MSILDVLTILRRNIVILGLAMLGALIVAVAYLHVATYRYSVNLVVAPVESTQGSSGGLGGLGGLASMAGINLGVNQGNSSFLKYIESIKSRAVADSLAKRPEIMRTQFASDWDESARRWREPRSLRRSITGPIRNALGFPTRAWRQPSGADLQAYLSESVLITRGLQTPFVTLEIVVRDPRFGVQFLLTLHREIDEVLRRAALARTNAQIAYLTATLQTVTVAEHRQAIAQALLGEEKVRMLASSSLPFAAEPLGPPSSSAGPISPRPILVLGLFLALGAIAGSMLVLGWFWLRDGEDLSARLAWRLGLRRRS